MTALRIAGTAVDVLPLARPVDLQTACHEAAHAVAAVVLGLHLWYVRVDPGAQERAGALGETGWSGVAGTAAEVGFVFDDGPRPPSREGVEVFARETIVCAVAPELWVDGIAPSGTIGYDGRVATRAAALAADPVGFLRRVRVEVYEMWRDQRSERIRDAVLALGDELIARREIDGPEAEAIVLAAFWNRPAVK